ncbi:MAG: hypothetical protein Q8N18_07960 [Opitutaceae bacterium]|nr:hypothetical protein [Opitutaceae bacterium]
MNAPAKTVFVFGLYLVVMGLGLLIAPNATLGPLGFPPSTEVWPRIVGLLTLCLAAYYIAAARTGLVPFFRWTVAVRSGVFVACGALVALKLAPAPLALIGVIDLAAACWTAWALHRTQPAS